MFSFKTFLDDVIQEEDLVESESSSLDTVVQNKINSALYGELDSSSILTVQSGIQKIRKTLHGFGYDMPVFYGLDPEGDEITFDLNRFDNLDDIIYLYVLYSITENGYYDFYAQVGDEETINNLVSEEVDEE